MVFNVNKTVCMYIRSILFKDLSVSTFYLNGNPIKYVHTETYLGFIMNNLSKHDDDIVKQSKSIYCRGNMLISNFKNCNIPIKIQLYKTYCSSLYCSHLWYNYSAKTLNKVKVAYK